MHVDTHLWSFVQWILFLLPLPPLTGHPEPLFLSQPIPKGPHSGPPFPSLTLPSPEPWDTHGVSQGSEFHNPRTQFWVNTLGFLLWDKDPGLLQAGPSSPAPFHPQPCSRPEERQASQVGSSSPTPEPFLSPPSPLGPLLLWRTGPRQRRGPAPTGSTVSSHTPTPSQALAPVSAPVTNLRNSHQKPNLTPQPKSHSSIEADKYHCGWKWTHRDGRADN